jgi:hypothetical protein
VLESQGIKYHEAFQMAMREIPEGNSATQRTTIANQADAASRRAIIARKNAGRDKFGAAVQADMKASGRGYTEAYNWTAKQQPELYTEMNLEIPTATGAGVYSDSPMPPGPASVTGQQIGLNTNGVDWAELQRLGLPVDCFPDELAAAKSCGSSDPAKLFDCMVAWISRTRNVNRDAAQAYCLGRFPKLAKTARITSPLMGPGIQQYTPAPA